MDLKFVQNLVIPAQTKIVMLIMDGLGGLPLSPGGKTELEEANTPNLDSLAAKSSLGLSEPIGPGITVESGPGHLGVFGYDPLQYRIGRGVLEAVGIGFKLELTDIAIRGNFCTVNENGVVTDRRAGRIPTERSKELSKLLGTQIEDIEIFVETIREHRLSIVLRGPGLSPDVSATDPLINGSPPISLRAFHPEAEKTSRVLNQFIERSLQIIRTYENNQQTNMVLLRGYDRYPNFPPFSEVFGLRAAAIAVYPTYRGIANLVGMHILPVEGDSASDEFTCLEKYWDYFDFFYLHIKETDLAGEDGDFKRKVKVIEDVDKLIPRLIALEPDVIIVSGDHSTPALMKCHSWHPVPTLIYSHYVRSDNISEFGERACAQGSLGILPAKHIMPIALANARRFNKWSN